MDEITYFLGAGASYNSKSLVNNFSERFGTFIKFFNYMCIENKKKYIEDCNLFIEEVKTHLSFDTYFKKLFHQNEFDKITKSKNILLLYFLFEHLIDISEYNRLLS